MCSWRVWSATYRKRRHHVMLSHDHHKLFQTKMATSEERGKPRVLVLGGKSPDYYVNSFYTYSHLISSDLGVWSLSVVSYHLWFRGLFLTFLILFQVFLECCVVCRYECEGNLRKLVRGCRLLDACGNPDWKMCRALIKVLLLWNSATLYKPL